MLLTMALKSINYHRDKGMHAQAEREWLAASTLSAKYKYYADAISSPGEAVGQAWAPDNAPEHDPNNPLAKGKPLLVKGQHVSFEWMDKIAAAIDPETGEFFGQRSKSGKPIKRDDRRPGYDMLMSPPKDIDIFYAAAFARLQENPDDERAMAIIDAIERTMHEANDMTLQHGYDLGLFVGRRNVTDPETGKTEFEYAKADHVGVVKFLHRTSREGDPLLHIHNIWMNAARYADGHTSAVDNIEWKRYGGMMAANFRGNFVERAMANLDGLLDLDYEKIKRNWGINGVDSELRDGFSMRTVELEEEAKKQGYDKAKHREALRNINANTKKKKADLLPFDQQIARWNLQLKAKGHNLDTLSELATESKRQANVERDQLWESKRKTMAENGIDLPSERPQFDEEEIKQNAFDALTKTTVVFNDQTMGKEIYEALQIYGGTSLQSRFVSELKASSKIVAFPKLEGMRDNFYSTPKFVDMEWKMLAKVKKMQGNLQPLNVGMIRRIVATGIKNEKTGETFQLTAKQAKAVEYVLGANQIAALEGRAGAGKTTIMIKVVESFKESDYEVWGTSASWKAVKVLSDDTGIEFGKKAIALTGLIAGYKNGNISFGKKSAIIVDEAGMVGLEVMAELVQISRETGCRLILSGDTRQLEAVPGGAPLRAMTELYGSYVLNDIIRQNHQWMREASLDLSERRTDVALREYHKRGYVHFVSGRKEVIERAVGDFKKAVEVDPDSSKFIIANTNAEVRAITKTLRLYLREQGVLKGDDFELQVLAKDGETKTKAGFAIGDRIQLGENLDVTGLNEKLLNGQTGTLKDVFQKEGQERVFVIKFDHLLREVALRESELVGFRKDKEPKLPMISHAYAGTNFGGQGSTFQRVFIINSDGWTWRQTYVGGTRHKESVDFYVERDRIADKIASKAGSVFTVAKGDKASARTEDDFAPDDVISNTEVAEEWFSESKRADAKTNVSDLHQNPREMVEEYEKIVELEEKMKLGENVSEIKSQMADSPLAMPVRGLGNIGRDIRTPPKPVLVAKAPAAPAATPAEMMEQRVAKNGFAVDKKEEPVNRESNRLSKAEVAELGEQNLFDYMLANGGTKKSKDTVTFGSGLNFIVKQWGGGNWTFFTRFDREIKGGIINFKMWLSGMNYGDAAHALRQEFGTKGKDYSSYQPKPAAAEKTFREKVYGEIKPIVADKLDKVRGMWSSAMQIGKDAINNYLTQRGFTDETQARLKEHLRFEDPSRKEYRDGAWVLNRNPHGVQIAQRNENGEVTGVTRKGPKQADGKSFSESAANSQRDLMRFTNPANPASIVVGEAAFDVMTIFQKEGYPADVLFLATAGAPSYRDQASLIELAEKYPNAKWRIIAQNDDASLALEEIFMKAIREGNPKAEIAIDKPKAEYKDFNDELRGIKKSVAPSIVGPRRPPMPSTGNSYAAAKARAEAEAKAQKEHAEALARQLELENGRDPNRPRGPRI
ncbi:hypothetical protein ELG97_37170 [Rhizobium leguminosarum]|uniref:MobF family relaxase n=1 Tax=Rhizobium leguminosarum TaxID=384 RepID=UPI00102FF6CB|nr:MobF family relaxase [Rhizobium leguminosarum]TBE73863.1 hypothetical protein ELG97_37170 [Rhizobium leguminosarum]